MASFNKTILIGNLTRDPELKYTPKGTAVTKVSLAVNRHWTNEAGERQEEVSFVDVSLFGRTAENVAQYMKKGRPMLVEGRLKTESWDDKQTGQKRHRLVVVGETVQFLGDRQQEETDPEYQVRPKGTKPTETQGELPPESDDVPF